MLVSVQGSLQNDSNVGTLAGFSESITNILIYTNGNATDALESFPISSC